MSQAANLAVEITQSEDSLDIWVDANNNGVRDDDDVNIYVTAGGGFYTVSPTFKNALDQVIQTQIKELAMGLLANPRDGITDTQETLRELALELVLRATKEETIQ